MRDVIFKQYDSRWGDLPYPTKSYSFAGSGCGCCAVTHLLIELPKYYDWNPKKVRPYMVSQGYATKGHGTLHAGITNTLKYYGLPSKMHGNMTSAFNTLNKIPEGRRSGIILFDKGTKGGVTWTSSGHYVAFTDYKVDEKGKHWFYMKDSGMRQNNGWFNYEEHMRGLIKEIWTVKLPAPQKGKYYTVGNTYKVITGVNVRTGASSVKYRKVGRLAKGTEVVCLGTSKNGRWIKHGNYRWSCGVDSLGKVYIK